MSDEQIPAPDDSRVNAPAPVRDATPASGADPSSGAVSVPEPRLHPVLFAFLVLGGVFFTYQVIGGLLTVVLYGTSITEENVQQMRGITMISQYLLLLLPAVLALRIQPWPLRRSLRLNPVRPVVLVPVIIGAVALQFAFQGYMAAQDHLLREYILSPALQSLIDKIDALIEGIYQQLLLMRSGGECLFVWLVVAVTPSICEEVVFRGVAQTAFEKSLRPRYAVLLSGGLFAAYHLNPISFVPLAVLGVLFAVAVYRSNSLWTGVVAHAATNSFAVFSLYFTGGATSALNEAPISSSPDVLALISAGGVLVFAASALSFWKLTRPAEAMSHQFP